MSQFATWLNTAQLPEFSDLVMKQFSHQKDMVQPSAAELFIKEGLTGWGSDTKRYDEVDVDTYAKLKEEGENAKRGRVGIGYSKTMKARRYALEINVSWEFRRYGQQYATQVKADLTQMNHYVPQRFDLNLSHIFTFATASSYTDMDGETIDTTTGDGFPLAYSAHSLAHSTLTYRNRLSGDPAFSQGALEVAEGLFVSDIMSNFGDRRVMTPNVIFSTDDPATCRAIKQLLNSTADVESSNAGVVNIQKGKYRHVILPMLATTSTGARDSNKKRWWGLVSSYGSPSNSWQGYFGEFESPNLKTPDENSSNDDWKYGVRGSMGAVALSGRGLVMSCPNA